MTRTVNPLPATASQVLPVAEGAVSVLQSSELFQGRSEIVIQHHGQDYRLRITRQNKMILTK